MYKSVLVGVFEWVLMGLILMIGFVDVWFYQCSLFVDQCLFRMLVDLLIYCLVCVMYIGNIVYMQFN